MDLALVGRREEAVGGLLRALGFAVLVLAVGAREDVVVLRRVVELLLVGLCRHHLRLILLHKPGIGAVLIYVVPFFVRNIFYDLAACSLVQFCGSTIGFFPLDAG